MEINCLPVGELMENCYLVFEGSSAVVIDPGAEAFRIISACEERGTAVSAVLLTHGHFDHIGAADEIRARYHAPLMIHESDAGLLSDAQKNLSAMMKAPFTVKPADRLLRDGNVIDAGGLSFRVMHTPGHSMGSVVYFCGDAMFSGDTLFAGSIGRTDFAGSDPRAMMRSLDLLSSLKEDYIVYPGHGESTMLAAEKSGNPFLGV